MPEIGLINLQARSAQRNTREFWAFSLRCFPLSIDSISSFEERTAAHFWGNPGCVCYGLAIGLDLSDYLRNRVSKRFSGSQHLYLFQTHKWVNINVREESHWSLIRRALIKILALYDLPTFSIVSPLNSGTQSASQGTIFLFLQSSWRRSKPILLVPSQNAGNISERCLRRLSTTFPPEARLTFNSGVLKGLVNFSICGLQ